MLNAFNKSQRECRAWRGQQPEEATFQASQPLLPLPNNLHLHIHTPTSLLLFHYCANNLACGNRISAYLRPQMKMPCYWFLLCFFPSSFVLVLFAASWQFNFAGVSTNIELVGKASSLQSRLTDNLELETSAQFYINYAIEWEKRRKRILNRYPRVLAQQKRQT